MNCRLAVAVIGLWVLTLLLATAQPHSAPSSKAESPPTPPKVNFVDIAERAGLTAKTEDGGDKTKRYIIETTGSGAAFFDFDNDGWPDIFLVNGSRLEGFPKGQEPTSHLYHNNHDGTFTDVTQKAGVGLIGWGQGVCAGDYDNDGFVDLFVTFWGHDVLLHNNGDGTFTDVTRKAGLWHDDVRWSTGCAFVDYDRDGRLDLFIAHYVDLDLPHTPEPGSGATCTWKGMPVMCGPRGLKGTHSELYHNNGDGTFTDVSEASGVAKTDAYYCFTALTGDFDNDGWPDIYVSCDSTPNLLFHNNHDGTFTETAVEAGVAFNDGGREQAGMGADAVDYDGDGWLDIIKTNFSDDIATLYHNNRDGTFSDVTAAAGLAKNSQFLGWGTLFLDIDNDGWPDIFMANGHVYPELDSKGLGLNSTFRERKLLYWNEHNGRFRDISLDAGPGITTPFNSHGVAAADFDNDGSVEILVNNSHDRPSLLKNLGDRGNWILLKLEGTKSNRDAIGAKVTVRVGDHQQTQEVRSGGGYISQSDFRLHFGLGKATKADSFEIRWPSGLVQRFENVAGNRIVRIRENIGIMEK
ncbi:MAG: CRTAC1 family protein [Terriglobales bacterium]